MLELQAGRQAGRRSHSCSESLSKPPHHPTHKKEPRTHKKKKKNPPLSTQYLQPLCYHSNSLGIHRRHRPFRPPQRKAPPLHCQSIILCSQLPAHPLLGTFLCCCNTRRTRTTQARAHSASHLMTHFKIFSSCHQRSQSAIRWNRKK